MSTEENKALIRRWLEQCYNEGNLAAADDFVAVNYVNHSAPHGQTPRLQGEIEYITLIRSAFPDIHLAIEDQIAEEDKVVTRLTATGTYRGGVEDIPPKAVVGKQVRVTEILIHRISSGNVVEDWMEFDQLGLWRQLGVIPPLGEAER
jgi:predicted ester cyclase